jgi:predicted transport protein
MTGKWGGSGTDYSVTVNDKSDLGYVLSLIVQAYEKTIPK